MAKKIKFIALFSTLATVGTALWHCILPSPLALALAISCGTTAYHFIMRLLVGWVINGILHNRINYRAKWFAVGQGEMKFYKKIGIKKWKNHMPTYDPGTFDKKCHSWEEIAQATCQAELVHEAIVILSFLPIAASVPFGELAVFVITSVFAAGFDTLFVMMQRFNRTRIIRLIDKNGTV
jgi:hypothetical protein